MSTEASIERLSQTGSGTGRGPGGPSRGRGSGGALPVLVLAILALVLWTLPAPALAAELIKNGTFDDDLSSWGTINDDENGAAWSPVDADGSATSGSALVSNSHPSAAIFQAPMVQCVTLDGSRTHRIGTEIMVAAGQPVSGEGWLVVIWYASEDCSGNDLSSAIVAKAGSPGTWRSVDEEILPPSGSRSVELRLGVVKNSVGGSLAVHFDNLSLRPKEDDDGPTACEELPGPYLTDDDFPGFRFKVELTNAAGVLAAAAESDCLAETLCVSGAMPGRTEVQVRFIGPRPNGYLWLQVVRFTPSKIRVLAEKISDGTCRLYTLEAISPASDDLDGFVDREAFLP